MIFTHTFLGLEIEAIPHRFDRDRHQNGFSLQQCRMLLDSRKTHSVSMFSGCVFPSILEAAIEKWIVFAI